MSTKTGEPFETETMAELCARQGRLGAAVGIYRNLLQAHPGHTSASRWATKLAELEAAWDEDDGGPMLLHDVALPPSPGVVTVTGQDASGESAAIVAWALPPTPSPPVVEIMLVLKGPDGIETVKRRLSVTSSSGRVAVPAAGLHSAMAAVGVLRGDVFVPLARSGLPSA